MLTGSAWSRIEELRVKVDGGTTEAAVVRDLSVLLFVVFEDSRAAAGDARLSPDRDLEESIRTACTPPARLTDAQWSKRADWYRLLGEKLGGPAQSYLLRESLEDNARFLTSRPVPGPLRQAALLSATRAWKLVEKSGATTATQTIFRPPPESRFLLLDVAAQQQVAGDGTNDRVS